MEQPKVALSLVFFRSSAYLFHLYALAKGLRTLRYLIQENSLKPSLIECSDLATKTPRHKEENDLHSHKQGQIPLQCADHQIQYQKNYAIIFVT